MKDDQLVTVNGPPMTGENPSPFDACHESGEWVDVQADSDELLQAPRAEGNLEPEYCWS